MTQFLEVHPLTTAFIDGAWIYRLGDLKLINLDKIISVDDIDPSTKARNEHLSIKPGCTVYTDGGSFYVLDVYAEVSSALKERKLVL